MQSYCCSHETHSHLRFHKISRDNRYAKHPPCFLAQSQKSDFNADTCAARVYHETLLAHGVKSELVLLPDADAKCSCVGSPDEVSAEGRASPLAKECALQV